MGLLLMNLAFLTNSGFTVFNWIATSIIAFLSTVTALLVGLMFL